ncbi:MAG TPA: TorF family putative porin [Phenylobacterium sp.]
MMLPLLVVAATLATSGAAFADDASPKVTFNIGAASDYVFRGVSQTNEDPEVFGGVDLTIDKLYAGVWASNIDFNDSTDAEVDLYAGFKPTLGPVSLDLGAIYYSYVNPPHGAHYGYAEIKALGTMPLGSGSLGAAFYYSPDTFGPVDNDSAYYYEVSGSIPLAGNFSVSGAVGRQEIAKTPADYTTWNLGVGYAFNDRIGVDVRYWDTNKHELGKIYGSRGVVSLKSTF